MEIGAVLSEAWDLYKRFWTTFIAVAAPVFIVLGLVSALAQQAGESSVGAGVFWNIVSFAAFLVGYFWLQGALVEAVQDVRDGRVDLTVGDLYGRARRRLPALIAAGVLAGIGILLGTILLVVPGLVLLTYWLLITPVIVLEGRSAGDSFGRSWGLVRGHAWRVFGLIVLTILLALLASIVVGAAAALVLAFLPDVLARWVGSAVVNTIVAPFIALSWTLVYYRLAGEPAPEVAPAPAS